MAKVKAKVHRAPAKAAAKGPAKARSAGTKSDLLEIGAKVVYGFKRDPGKRPWETTAKETRAAYRARIQELLNELAAEGFVVGR